jgi:hypothetical protein
MWIYISTPPYAFMAQSQGQLYLTILIRQEAGWTSQVIWTYGEGKISCICQISNLHSSMSKPRLYTVCAMPAPLYSNVYTFLVYLMMLSIARTILHRMLGWVMNCKVHWRKRRDLIWGSVPESWGGQKIYENPQSSYLVLGQGFKRRTSRIRSESVNHW